MADTDNTATDEKPKKETKAQREERERSEHRGPEGSLRRGTTVAEEQCTGDGGSGIGHPPEWWNGEPCPACGKN